MKNLTKTTQKTISPKSLSRLPGRKITSKSGKIACPVKSLPRWISSLSNRGLLLNGALLVSFIFLYTLSINHGYAQVIAGGWQHSLFACADSTARSCGRNVDGQLGDGTTTDKTTAVQVSGLTGITAVAVGQWHSLFLKNNGTVWACGRNDYGQLGDGTTTDKTTAVQVSGLTGITAVAAGYRHSLFLKNDSTVWACGRNNYGQLGDGTTINTTLAMQVSGITGITAVAAGTYHSLFLKNDSTVWACGYNWAGQLGDGTNTDKTTAVQVSGLTGITVVAAGETHSLFVKNDGSVRACGYNSSGQLGNGSTMPKNTAVQVSGLTGITAVASGDDYSLFLKNDGSVWACGDNWYGQLGDGTTTDKSTAVQVSGLTGITAVAAGDYHSLFLKNDGTVWACGWNASGQLGDGTTAYKTIAVQVTGLCTVGDPCTPPTLSISSSDVSCAGASDGTATVTPAGGATPYNYNWSNSQTDSTATGLAAGTYNITVTDSNGCTTNNSIIITQPPPINITDSAIAICNGDSAIIYGTYRTIAGTYYDSLTSVAGCDSVHSTVLTINPIYNISDPPVAICNGDSALIYGTYRITAGTYYNSLTTVNGCDSIHSTVLTVNPTYSSSDSPLTICNGDSALIYGVYRTTAGTYYDSLATVNGCDSVHSTVLSVNPTYSISDTPMAICNGDSALIYGTYQTAAGTYYDSLTTIDGCDSIHSTVLINPTYNISDPPVAICNGDSALIYGSYRITTGTYYDSLTSVAGCDSVHSTVLSVNLNPSIPTITQNVNTLSSTTANSYQWFFNGDTIPGETSQNYIATQSGFYMVAIIDTNGCSATSDTLSATISNIQEIESVYGLKIYPNPNTGIFTIEMEIPETQDIQLRIFNILGQSVYTEKLNNIKGNYKKQIDLKPNPTGIYNLLILPDHQSFSAGGTNENTINKKIILDH